MTSRKKKDYTKLLSITECDICHLELSDPRRIECGHIFCLHCLGKHLRYTASCPTCKRHMKPELGKVENYPVATEIVHLLQSLQKVASCSNILDAEENKVEDDVTDGNEYQYAEVDADQYQSVVSNELCDIHGQKLVSVCVTCDNELICAKCSIHSTHDKQEISEHIMHLERLLDQQKTDLLQRQKDDEAEEEKLQDMIEKQVEQKETIKDEIEDIAEGMFAQIHMKKEEMLQPIEKKADEYVKHLTERQEHIKDRKSEFHHISSKIGNLQNDDPTDYCRKAKRLGKQANIALRVENKPVPQYQTIKFTRNERVLEDLLKLQLGDVKIEEVSIAQDDEYHTSDFDSFEEEAAPARPKPEKTENQKEHMGPYYNLPPRPRPRPPLPPRPQKQTKIPLPAKEEPIYERTDEPDDTLYDDAITIQNVGMKPAEESDDNQECLIPAEENDDNQECLIPAEENDDNQECLIPAEENDDNQECLIPAEENDDNQECLIPAEENDDNQECLIPAEENDDNQECLIPAEENDDNQECLIPAEENDDNQECLIPAEESDDNQECLIPAEENDDNQECLIPAEENDDNQECLIPAEENDDNQECLIPAEENDDNQECLIPAEESDDNQECLIPAEESDDNQECLIPAEESDDNQECLIPAEESDDNQECLIPAEENDDNQECLIPAEENDDNQECLIPAEENDDNQECLIPAEENDDNQECLIPAEENDDNQECLIPAEENDDNQECLIPAEENDDNQECLIPAEENDDNQECLIPAEENDDNQECLIPAEENDDNQECLIPAEENDDNQECLIPAEENDDNQECLIPAEENDDNQECLIPAEENDDNQECLIPAEENDDNQECLIPAEENDDNQECLIPAEENDDNQECLIPAEENDDNQECLIPAEENDDNQECLIPAEENDDNQECLIPAEENDDNQECLIPAEENDDNQECLIPAEENDDNQECLIPAEENDDNQECLIPAEEKDINQERHCNPPPLSPFSGTFRQSVSIAIDNRAFPQRLFHRVFLPFRLSGFTVVQGSLGNYYTFVTDDRNVKMFKQNGEFYRTITDLIQPFDVASQQHGVSLTRLYITDEGRRMGDGSVRVYTSEGEFLKVLVGRLRKPQGISLSRVGLVYVCDEASILVFCPKTGKKKRIISTIGKDPIFVRPMYVMVSATGKLLVSDVGTRELKIHDETRKYTDKFKPDENEGELYTSFTPGMCSEDSSSNYYVIDQERNMLYMLRGGGRSEKLELPQKPKGHDGIPTAVSFDTDTGNIVVF